MVRIEKCIIINKSIDEVFTYASEWENLSDWFEGISGFMPTTETKKGNEQNIAEFLQNLAEKFH